MKPKWHAEAQRLRLEDPKKWSYAKLGKHFNRSEAAAYWAVNPDRDPNLKIKGKGIRAWRTRLNSLKEPLHGFLY